MNAPLRSAGLADATQADRLSVVHVVRQFHPNRGGLEDVVANLAREQLQMGIAARVVTLDRLFSRLDEKLPETGSLDGLPIRRIPFTGSTRYPIAPKVFGCLAGADIVHVHAVDFFFDAIALAKPLLRTPIVATTHGGFFHTQASSSLKRFWFNGPTRLSANTYDRIVACSASDGASFSRIAASKVEVIENGVDLAKFAGASSPSPVKRMVSIGRFSRNKRLDRLIEAMSALTRDDPDWRLDIVGAESDWTAADLEAMIRSAGLEGRVSVHVGLDNAQVAEVMSRSSFFVSASEYEGFGLALIEALSAGLSPIAHPNVSFRLLAERHPAIRTADFAVADQAAAAIRASHARLVARPSLVREALAELEDYAWPSVARRYHQVYRDVIGTRGF